MPTATATVRPMRPDDVHEADAMAWAALREHIPADFLSSGDAEDEIWRERGRARVAHLLSTDPGGAWVAELGDEVVGLALALVREEVWGLSLFAVRPGLQGQGLGGRVLAPALEYADGCRGAIILSSPDPRAMRRYFRAGFRIKPCLAAAGQINRSRIPDGLRSRPGDPAADRATVDAASRHARGASHARDLEAMLAAGAELLVIEDRGWATHRDGSPMVVAARDDDAAADLLWSCLARGPAGESVHVDFVAEHNDWAIRVALDAGLVLSPDGPVFVRGETGPFAPYLPSGAYL
jgi:GNAT superfamily N-acetyltransferase